MVSEYNPSTAGGRKNFSVKSIPYIPANFLVFIPASYAYRGMKTERRNKKEVVEGWRGEVVKKGEGGGMKEGGVEGLEWKRELKRGE